MLSKDPKGDSLEPGYTGVLAENITCDWTSKVTLVTENRYLELMILVLFYLWEETRPFALIEIIP